MAKKPQPPEVDTGKAKFEYRVWGKHRKARRLLEELADETYREQVDDCYLLVDDPSWNAKVRDNTLKVKQLLTEDKGFERWASGKYHSADAAPSPFDELYDELDLDRAGKKAYDLVKAVEQLDPKLGVRAVFVTKDRRRYRVGDLRAEVTDVEIEGSKETLRTLAIEGDDLDQLVSLRKKLGLRGEPNTPVHQAIDVDVDEN